MNKNKKLEEISEKICISKRAIVERAKVRGCAIDDIDTLLTPVKTGRPCISIIQNMYKKYNLLCEAAEKAKSVEFKDVFNKKAQELLDIINSYCDADKRKKGEIND